MVHFFLEPTTCLKCYKRQSALGCSLLFHPLILSHISGQAFLSSSCLLCLLHYYSIPMPSICSLTGNITQRLLSGLFFLIFIQSATSSKEQREERREKRIRRTDGKATACHRKDARRRRRGSRHKLYNCLPALRLIAMFARLPTLTTCLMLPYISSDIMMWQSTEVATLLLSPSYPLTLALHLTVLTWLGRRHESADAMPAKCTQHFSLPLFCLLTYCSMFTAEYFASSWLTQK